MTTVLSQTALENENHKYFGTGARSQENRSLGFRPAFMDKETGIVYGSCSPDGRLLYSWRLILAPPPVLAYVAAHEVAHLVELNHSPAYWRVVTGICPDWKRHRDWLRTHGSSLHRLRFQE